MTGRRADLRVPVLALVAWGAALAGFWLPAPALAIGLVGAAGWVLWSARHGRPVATAATWLLAAGAVIASVLLQVAAVEHSPVRALAADGARVHAELVVRSDPVTTSGRFGDQTMFHALVVELTGRGARYAVRAPVLVLADPDVGSVRYGTRLLLAGRLEPARGDDLAAVLSTRGPPEVLARPGPALRVAERLRAGIRAAVAESDRAPRALVPALVDGDTAGLPDAVVEDFRTSGLTHLLAVSGTNLTLVVGFLLIIARGIGVRARGLMVVGCLGVVGFVLLARSEPSVLRAAAMGSVALLGMGSGARARGTRALGAAVLCLLLVDPWLARSLGFALSAGATAGILFLAPPWRDALMRWLPRWAAEAVAVPLAAQLACTPLVAAISGQVSMVAVGANMLVAAAVGPATVLGLLGGAVATFSTATGRLVAQPAVWCADWIIGVATHSSALPVASWGWGSGPLAIGVLTAVCMAAALVMGQLLARRGVCLGVTGVFVVAMLVPVPTPGWPPPGWLLVACDVGQGDGLVLRAAAGVGVVVDTGPDPVLMDRCLRRLHIYRVPLIVLTHFHADHVDGLAGVLKGRRVGEIEVTAFGEPEAGSRLVRALAARAGVPVTVAAYGETRSVGSVRWQVLAPSADPPADSDSPPNDASIVMYVETRGVRILMMGDEETGSQQRLARLVPGLKADVLKVAHHGSAKQDPDLVRSLGARLALISDGVDNDYGHPAPSTLRLLRSARMLVRRTDLDGDLAVFVDPTTAGLRVRTRMPRPPPRPGR